MTIIEQIKTEIERRITDNTFGAKLELIDLLAWLDTLESERLEPYNPVYDEVYLNEKIKRATESWKGVDVDAMLAECRGYDEEKSKKPMNPSGSSEIPKDLEEAADEYLQKVKAGFLRTLEHPTAKDCFKDGAKWQYQKDRGKFAQIKAKTWSEGFDACKEQMMKGAMEYEVGMHGEPIEITLDKYVQRAKGIFPGAKIRVIVLQKED